MRRLFFTLAASLLCCGALSAAPGDFDANFGSNGIGSIKVGDASFVTALALQSDGRIVAVGPSFIGSQTDFAVARFNADGTVDTGFGIGGSQTVDVGGNGKDDVPMAVALQSNGKIIVAGFTELSGTDFDIVVMRFTADGFPDDTFGDFGAKVIALSDKEDVAASLLIQSDDKIVVGGRGVSAAVPNGGFAVARLTAEGDLDTTFAAPDGFLVADFLQKGANINDGVLIEDDGLFFAGNILTNTFNLVPGLLKLDRDGNPFPGFGTDGKVSVDLGAGLGIAGAVEPLDDGKILIAGAFGTADADAGIARLSAEGNLDPTFASSGLSITPVSDTLQNVIFRADLQANGKLVAVATSLDSAPTDLVVLRYLPDGTLDDGFGSGGKVPVIGGFFNPGLPLTSLGLALQPDGKILAGGVKSSATTADFEVARLEGDPDVCGDGIVGVSEQCDDGNTADGDGCSAACQTEAGGATTGGDTAGGTTAGDAAGGGNGGSAGGGCSLIR